jgi:hypothetical protein
MSKYGLQSFYLQYFPDPSRTPVIDDFCELRGFLWQRRPREGFNADLGSQLCGSSLASMHIHLAADDGENYLVTTPLATTSKWSADNSIYLAHLRSANVFFAPRATEGIGISNLEAMAHGMCVLAHNDATANEYLINGENGYLYNILQPQEVGITPKHAKQFGRAARKTIEVGYENFLEKCDSLLSFIESTPKPSPLYRYHFPPKDFIASARLLFGDAPGMQGLLSKAEGRGAIFDFANRAKRRVRRIPILGTTAKGVFNWLRSFQS